MEQEDLRLTLGFNVLDRQTVRQRNIKLVSLLVVNLLMYSEGDGGSIIHNELKDVLVFLAVAVYISLFRISSLGPISNNSEFICELQETISKIVSYKLSIARKFVIITQLQYIS